MDAKLKARIVAVLEANGREMQSDSYYPSSYGVSEDDYEKVAEGIGHVLAELDATPPAGAGEAVAARWEILFGKDVPAMLLVQAPDTVRSEARAQQICGLLGGGTTYRPLYAAPTPLPEAVRELVMRWRDRAEQCRLYALPRSETYDICADELDAALRAIGAGS